MFYLVKYKRLFIFFSIIIIAIISFKPMVFVTHYLSAKYWTHVQYNKSRADFFILKAVNYNPQYSYNDGLENSLLKAAIFFNKIKMLKRYTDAELVQIKRTYKDNFYFQNLLNNLKVNQNWEHLDQLSYFFLSRVWANTLTMKILTQLKPQFTKPFLENLLDFLNWYGNDDLFNYIVDKFSISDYTYQVPQKGVEYQYSLNCMGNILGKEFKIGKNHIGANNLIAPDFEDEEKNKLSWTFSKMFDIEPFGLGAFYFNRDVIGNNTVFRGFNPYLDNPENCTQSRGGIWYREGKEIFKGYYLFGFDYWLKNGQEKPSFWLNSQIRELLLPPTNGYWNKVIFIFNNKKGKLKMLSPLIRMYGKGSFWFDNIFLGKIEVDKIDFQGSSWNKIVPLNND